MSIGYSDDDPLMAADRAYSNTDLAVYDLDGDGLGESDDWLGSSFIPAGRFGGYMGDGSVWRSGLADRENSDRFNRADYRMVFNPVQRRFAFGALTYPVSDTVEVFAEMNYSIVMWRLNRSRSRLTLMMTSSSSRAAGWGASMWPRIRLFLTCCEPICLPTASQTSINLV